VRREFPAPAAEREQTAVKWGFVRKSCRRITRERESTVLIGFTVEGYKEWHPAAITAAMRRLGVNFIEFNLRIVDELERVIPQLRGVRTAFHLPIMEEDGWDCTSVDRADEIDRLVAILQSHHRRLGLTHFIAHPPESNPDSPAYQASLETLFTTVARLPLPTFFENVVTTSPEQIRFFLTEAQKRLGGRYAGMCFDAAHFMISGQDPVEQFLAFRDEIGAVHLSDCVGNEDSHLPFGSGGELPVKKLLRAMRRSGYDGSITLEIRPKPGDDLFAFIESYMLMLRCFSPGRYLGARLRLFAMRHLLRRMK